FCGLAATWLAAVITVPGKVHFTFGHSSRLALLYALGGIVVAIVAAHQRTLSSRAADLLRRVPRRAAGWRAVTLESAVVAVAVAAVIQLKAQTGTLSGVPLLAPGLVILAVAVLAGRFVPAIASRIGVAALSTGGATRTSWRPQRRRSKAHLGLGL